jgi:hypothetical protein
VRAERKPKLHVHTRDLYVRVNRDRTFVYVRVCVHSGVDEGRVNVEGEAGDDIPTRYVDEYMSRGNDKKGGDRPVKICTAMV